MSALAGTLCAFDATRQTYRFDVGGVGDPYTDAAGHVWHPCLPGGTQFNYREAGLPAAGPDAALYETVCYGYPSNTLSFDVPPGDYTFTLSAQELYFTQAGKRIISVREPGSPPLLLDHVELYLPDRQTVYASCNVTVTNSPYQLDILAEADGAWQLAAVQFTPR